MTTKAAAEDNKYGLISKEKGTGSSMEGATSVDGQRRSGDIRGF